MTRDDSYERKENMPNKHQANGDRPTCNNSRPVDAAELFTDPWMPGLVQVEFKNASDSGVDIDDLDDDAAARRKPGYRKLPNEWCGDLREVLRDYKLSAWEPSFPLKHSWSRQTREQARKFYQDSGRQKFVTFRFPENADVAEIAAKLREVPEIERAKPVSKVIPPQIDDEYFGDSDQVVQPLAEGGFENQWYAHRCNLPQALAQQINGNGVVIAALDWGFDVSHPDYSEAIELTKNVKYDNKTVGNGNAIHHGTGTLGLAGARLNSKGMVGFAPRSILWAIQAGEDDDFTPQHWADAIDFVREEPSAHRKVIILEIQTAFRGNIESEYVINKAIRDAIAAGIVVCVPAGNAAGDADKDEQGNDIPVTGSILVGATTINDVLNSKSGDRVVVYAPGDQAHDLTCTSTSFEHRYTNYFGGTSGAVAKVGGAVALLLQADATLTPAQVKALIRRSEKRVLETENGPEIPNAVLLDCGHSVYICARQKQPERVLTNYSAVV